MLTRKGGQPGGSDLAIHTRSTQADAGDVPHRKSGVGGGGDRGSVPPSGATDLPVLGGMAGRSADSGVQVHVVPTI